LPANDQRAPATSTVPPIPPSVEYEITPEPTPEEREAIVAALAELAESDPGRESAWWSAGIRENVEPES